MIIGVGNGQFSWMYGTESEVSRAPGGIRVCIPNAVIQIHHAGMSFKVAWEDVSWTEFAFFRAISAPPVSLTNYGV